MNNLLPVIIILSLPLFLSLTLNFFSPSLSFSLFLSLFLREGKRWKVFLRRKLTEENWNENINLSRFLETKIFFAHSNHLFFFLFLLLIHSLALSNNPNRILEKELERKRERERNPVRRNSFQILEKFH